LLLLLLLSKDQLLDDIGVYIFNVNLLLLEKLNDLLKLILGDLIMLLVHVLTVIFLIDDLILNILTDNISSDLLLRLHVFVLLGPSSTLGARTLLYLLLSFALFASHLHLLLMLHLHEHLLLIHFILKHLLLSFIFLLILVLVLDLHLVMLVVQVLGPFLVILLYLIAFMFDLLSPSNNLALRLRALHHCLLEYHLLRIDVLYRLHVLALLLLLLLLARTLPLLLLTGTAPCSSWVFNLERLKQLLRDLELTRVLVVLLLQVLDQQLTLLVVQGVQIYHHILLVVIIILFFSLIIIFFVHATLIVSGLLHTLLSVA
jgi:hypothetical protein